MMLILGTVLYYSSIKIRLDEAFIKLIKYVIVCIGITIIFALLKNLLKGIGIDITPLSGFINNN
jgi:hypothetical protein